jgi:hypothetical protein
MVLGIVFSLVTARITATIVHTIIIAATTPIIAHTAITATTAGTDITGSSVPQTESPVQRKNEAFRGNKMRCGAWQMRAGEPR